MIHDGTTGNTEGLLFATSTDGYDFSAWNGVVEVIPRNLTGWDVAVGGMTVYKDAAGMWRAYYSGGLTTGQGSDSNFGDGIGFASSLDGITWQKYPFNPILKKTDSLRGWKRTYLPCVMKDNTGTWLYFSMKSSTSVYSTVRSQITEWI
jgi:hypothetical protein